MISVLTANDLLDALFAKGLTISDIARGTGTARSTIFRIKEGAKPHHATYVALRQLAVKESEGDVRAMKFLIARLNSCMIDVAPTSGEEE